MAPGLSLELDQRQCTQLLVCAVAVYGLFRQCHILLAPVRLQHQFKVAARRFLIDKLNLKLIKRQPLTETEWEDQPGWRLMPLMVISINPILSLAFIVSGRYQVGLQIGIIGLLLGGILKVIGTRSRWLMLVMRVMIVHQYTSLFLAFEHQVDALALRRALITRSMLTLFFFDNLDESFVQYLVFALLLKVRGNDVSAVLPIRIFLTLALPAEIMGVRDWLLSLDLFNRSIFALTGWRIIVFFSPFVVTIFFSFSGADQIPRAMLYVISGLNMFLFATSLIFPDIMDSLIMPSVVHAESLARENAPCTQPRPAWEPYDKASRFVTIGLHLFILCVLKWRPDDVVTILGLSLLRLMLFSIIQQRFSQHCKDSALLRGMMLLMDSGNMSSMILFITTLEVVVGLLLSSAQERASMLMMREAESRAFLDHAYKQKLSAVSHALEQVLDSGVNLSESRRILIQESLHESHKGHDRCHISNVARLLGAGRYRVVASEKTLKQAIASWHASKWMKNEVICSPDAHRTHSTVLICLDWDLLRLVVADWSRLLGVLVVSAEWEDDPALDGGRQVSITVRAETPMVGSRLIQTNLTAHRLILEALGSGKVFSDFQGFRVYGEASEASVRQASAADVAIPRGLMYAVLDDNLLVRKNIMRTLKSEPLLCHADSFAFGDSSIDCEAFASELVSRKVDVAIFDQNLEIFDSRGIEYSIKGSDIARRARDLGYCGVAVLHTADQYSAIVDEKGLFDGYVSKAASKHAFLEGLTGAWKNHAKLDKRVSY